MKVKIFYLGPTNAKEALNDMWYQMKLWECYNQGIIEEDIFSKQLCQKKYTASRQIAINEKGLGAVKDFPQELK